MWNESIVRPPVRTLSNYNVLIVVANYRQILTVLCVHYAQILQYVLRFLSKPVFFNDLHPKHKKVIMTQSTVFAYTPLCRKMSPGSRQKPVMTTCVYR